jgi:hypothetical protein
MTEFKEFDSVAVVTLMRCENAKRGTLIEPVLGDFIEQTDEALNEFLSAESIQNGFKVLDDLLFHITGYKGEVHSVHYEYPETVFYLQMGAKFLKKSFPEIWGQGISSPHKGNGDVNVKLINRLPGLLLWQNEIRQKFGKRLSVPSNVILDCNQLLETCEELSRKIHILSHEKDISTDKSLAKHLAEVSDEFCCAFKSLNEWLKAGYFLPEKWEAK